MLKKPKGRRQIERAQQLQDEAKAVKQELARLQRRLLAARTHAAEQLTGLKPGNMVTVAREFFTQQGYQMAWPATGTMLVRKIGLMYSDEDPKRANPRLICTLRVGHQDGPVCVLNGKLHDFRRYFTKVQEGV